MIVEVAGGLLSGSLALLSDALHNLSDVAALVLALASAQTRSPSQFTKAHKFQQR